jgi:hypothetical protein
VPVSSTDHHLPSSNSNGNYQKLLHRRPDLSNSSKKSTGTTTSFEQTLTFIEQLKRNQHRSITEMNRQIPREMGTDRKILTPQELCYQVNLKLDYLIRTRGIERHRLMTQMNILPSTKMIKSKTTPRENFNQTALAYLNESQEINVVSSSTMTTNTATSIRDDLVDKESFGDNDEACEEMVEEENVNFLQAQP